MNRFLFMTSVLVVSLGINSAAHAAFEWIPPSQSNEPVLSAQPVIEATPAPAPVLNSGDNNMIPMPPAPQEMAATEAPAAMSVRVENAPRRTSSDVVDGFGRDIPLTIATRQIVPSSFAVQYSQGVDPNTSVTWSGGRAWKTVLADALAERGLKPTIIADSVMIEPVAPPQELKPEPLPLPTPEVVVEAMEPIMPAPEPVAVAPVPAAPAVQMWVAPKSSTSRQVLSDWSRTAGVQLQWSAQYDYPLMSDAQITGSFEEAVETLLAGLVDAQPRPIGRLHPNEPNGPAILVIETRHIME